MWEDVVPENEIPTADVLFYTSQSCGMCKNYEVLLEHLLSEEHSGITLEKVILGNNDSDQQVPSLIIRNNVIDVAN